MNNTQQQVNSMIKKPISKQAVSKIRTSEVPKNKKWTKMENWT
jgi:hypothetical protein